ncbi:MAG: aryl-sulfate sulfotransferase [Solirubrobacterales bacterium]|nr:aryl-sulfate sulfotransferase [Solirubrobacterales bacterium]
MSTSVNLKAGHKTVVRLSDPSGTTSHSIRCLPADFPSLASAGLLPASIPLLAINDISGRAQAGRVPTSYAAIVDRRGAPIWWRKDAISLVNFFATPDGKLAFGKSGSALEIRTLNGHLSSAIKPTVGETDAHEAVQTSRGTWLMAMHESRTGVDLRRIGLGAGQRVTDSKIVEVDAKGRTVWSWKSSTHLATSETLLPQITKSKLGNITSFRETSAVYRIRMGDGGIDWKLGGTATPVSLNILGDPGIAADRHLLGQHDARLLADGTLSMLDNGSTLVEKGISYSRPPRALRIGIDPLTRSASLVDVFSDPSIGSSPCCGGARLMPDGTWLVAWGGTPFVRAYAPDKAISFSLRFTDPKRFTYRAVPLISPLITERTVVAGMDLMNK